MTEFFPRSYRQGGIRYGQLLKNGSNRLKLDFSDGVSICAAPIWELLSNNSNFDFLDLYEIFGRQGELNVEIGIGNGDFIVHSAHTGGNWLGFEPVKEFFLKAVKKVKQAELCNVRLIQFDAEPFVRLLPLNSVHTFYLNFPDPWPKQRHKKRRLLKSWFIELLSDRLAKEGRIIVLTDHQDYAEEILANFKEVKTLASESIGGYSSQADGYYQTKYFKKFAKCGKLFYFNYKLVDI
ncbi:MAG: tRNA (guanosine(46)-N7)-methyltransferase TrmB [Deferribacteraceae bacterium]|nr:tRNA (guanosine(46)-N7)-methyltransferase TrmB [Deferribacteraceae bacterium]